MPLTTSTATAAVTHRAERGATMAEALPPAALLRLQVWLSPAFPVGGFSYSHGLESAAGAGLIEGTDGLAEWLSALVSFGSGWNDAVLFAEAWRRASMSGEGPLSAPAGTRRAPAYGGLAELAALGEALAGSRERHAETMAQGEAFLAAVTRDWPHPALERLPASCPYPVAVGTAAGAHGLPLEPSLAVFLQAFVTNLTQAAIRLGITGQSGAVAVVAALEGTVAATARRAEGSSLDDLGSATVASEIMAMRHETHYSRLFRS
jgi:urease accessory protein